MNIKRSTLNVFGVSVLVAFFSVVLVVEGGRRVLRSTLEWSTKTILDTTAHQFADGDKDVMLEWASGGIRDGWDEPIQIGVSTRSEVQLVSKGPDRLIGTEDDIRSEVCKISPLAKEEVKDVSGLVKDKIDHVKKSVDDSIKKGRVKGDGWHFEWRWGKTKEADEDEGK